MTARSLLTSSVLGLGAALVVAFDPRGAAAPAKKPLKVFILAGDSAMAGHARVRSFGALAEDPLTAPLLAEMRNADGTPRVCEKVWIAHSHGDAPGGPGGERRGRLTADHGAELPGQVDDPRIGPEFTFGIYVQKLLDEPILLVKTAWDGRSLHTDFRPPSAGPYEFRAAQLARYAEHGEDLEAIRAEKAAATGRSYRLMIESVREVLTEIAEFCPDHDPAVGHELAGFVWFQGENDLRDHVGYPDGDQPGGFVEYGRLLSHLVEDVRKDLSAPGLPFVIGVMGGDGVQPESARQMQFRQAMAAPATRPEFRGNVVNVMTGMCWDERLGEPASRRDEVEGRAATQETDRAGQFTAEELRLLESGASDRRDHDLGSAKLVAQIGKRFAEAMVELMRSPNASPRVRETTRYGARCLELEIAGLRGFVILPTEPAADGSRPWVWYAPAYWSGYPGKRLTWLFSRLLKQGYHVCGTDVGDSFGSPQSRASYGRFYDHVVGTYGLSAMVCLLPQSRGGLMWYNWAVENPEKVACIGGIYPVCDLTSYPGLRATAVAYGMTEAELGGRLAMHNPVDRLMPLANAKVPVLHLHGDRDTVVPLEKNSGALLERYRLLGGPGELLVIEGKGHAEVPEFFESARLSEFFLEHGRVTAPRAK
jgi:pimeloyl-ACP methyl ester carboxylesterase